MKLKLRKVVKNNIVDYGTPDPVSRGFEHKFQMHSLIKDYKKIFEKNLSNSPRSIHKANTEMQLITNKYYKKILSYNKTIFRLKNLRNEFKNSSVINNEYHLYNINHMNDIYRMEKSQNLRYDSPFLDSFYNKNKTSESFWKSNKINDIKLFGNENQKKIYKNDGLKYKKINNNIKSNYFRLKYKDFITRKKSLIKLKHINSAVKNTGKININIDPLKKKKIEDEKIRAKEIQSEDYSDYFIDSDFSQDQTIKFLKNKYNFYHNKNIDMEDINTRYFLMLKNMLNSNPAIKLYNANKESKRKVNLMKKRYVIRKIK